jgi:cation diffusion facilitator CzcD-associated flavoprotein CzcO
MIARELDASHDATSHPIGEHRPIRVACIGAGYSGLMMSIMVEQKMKTHNVSFQLYEMNEDLVGTWLVNR